jgi:hypothetical protein
MPLKKLNPITFLFDVDVSPLCIPVSCVWCAAKVKVLAFYVVKHFHNGEWRRGAVFIKEIVPKRMIAVVANTMLLTMI